MQQESNIKHLKKRFPESMLKIKLNAGAGTDFIGGSPGQKKWTQSMKFVELLKTINTSIFKRKRSTRSISSIACNMQVKGTICLKIRIFIFLHEA